jgi:hypothetical protein
MPLKSFVSIYVVGAMLYSSLYHALKPLRQARRDDVIVGRDTKGEQPLKL